MSAELSDALKFKSKQTQMIPSDVTQAKYFCGGDVLVVFASPTSLPHSLTLSPTCDQMKCAVTSRKITQKQTHFLRVSTLLEHFKAEFLQLKS